MRKIYLLMTVFVVAFACSPEEEEEQKIREVPEDIIASKPCETLFNSIIEMYPEHKNNFELQPALFSDTVQKRIVLTKESEVYISFISEGAGWANALGWYAYNSTEEPPQNTDFHREILFPHVSDTVLTKGDMLQVGEGPFKAGTVLSFYLVLRGWENGTLNLKRKQMVFTDYNLNTQQHQQHILFKEGNCGDIVLAFEDRGVELESDFDYNDIIITVSDNNQQLETVSFDIDNIVIKNP